MALFHTTVLDNQIKALDTIGTASGSIATFETDKAERLVSCVCEVASGCSEVNVTRCGKNLVNLSDESFTANANTTRILGNIYLKAGTYTWSYTLSTNLVVTRNRPLYVVNGSNVYAPADVITSGRNSWTFILAEDNTISLRWWAVDNNNAFDLTDFQIEKSNTKTDYVSYNGNTYNIPFGETLSGDGTFDVLSGILTRSDNTTKQLDANYIQTNNGTNNVYSDTGDIIDLKFVLSVGKAIS